MRTRLESLSTRVQPGEGAFLGDDWATQGDCVGRYGRVHATLSAMDGGSSEPFKRLSSSPDHILKGAEGYEVSVRNGLSRKTSMVP